jgi:hypothetical protein
MSQAGRSTPHAVDTGMQGKYALCLHGLQNSAFGSDCVQHLLATNQHDH